MNKGAELAAILAMTLGDSMRSGRRRTTPDSERLEHQIENMRLELLRLQEIGRKQGHLDKYQVKRFQRTEETRQRLLSELKKVTGGDA